MSVVGIIAEYNPFHKGHEYHIQKAKEETGASEVVVLMSGNFVQRGEPAVYNKYSRASMAIQAGADLVLELPACFSISSANYFAGAAVNLMDRLGIVDFLSFGSESGDIKALKALADELANESSDYQSIFKAELKNGKSIPSARQTALEALGLDASILASPNNILAVEYLIALSRQKSSMRPHTIKRMGAGYNNSNIDRGVAVQKTCEDYASAMGIRNALKKGESVKSFIPSKCMDSILLNEAIFYDDIKPVIYIKLFEMLSKKERLDCFTDVDTNFSKKVEKVFFKNDNFDQLLDALATKDTTLAHTKRALLHILLGQKQEDFDKYIDKDFNFFIRVLGFRRDSRGLLKSISQNSDLPLISNAKDGTSQIFSFYEGQSELERLACNQYMENCYADDVYRMLQMLSYKHVFKHDFEYKTVIV